LTYELINQNTWWIKSSQNCSQINWISSKSVACQINAITRFLNNNSENTLFVVVYINWSPVPFIFDATCLLQVDHWLEMFCLMLSDSVHVSIGWLIKTHNNGKRIGANSGHNDGFEHYSFANTTGQLTHFAVGHIANDNRWLSSYSHITHLVHVILRVRWNIGGALFQSDYSSDSANRCLLGIWTFLLLWLDLA